MLSRGMTKTKTTYVCQKCGAVQPKWGGQCPDCNEWNTLVEEISIKEGKNHRGWSIQDESEGSVLRLDAPVSDKTPDNRWSTGLGELDRVLGGGLVPGSYILLGGDPGIGKSTLLLQMAGGVACNSSEVLYVSGEESVRQTALRAKRLGISSPRVKVAAESRLETIMALAKKHEPRVLIVDSIQTVYLSEISSAPGSVSQVRECASYLMGLAKSHNMSIFLIGHVTKDGNIAGPKVLEHMVDTVLSFEGDHSHQFRLLRALKNRFGATNELGVFQMDSGGLLEVPNPSELFLEERGKQLIGSAVYAAMEGSRPLLCEIQALNIFSPMAMPRRTSLGFDINRVHLLAAVLDKQLDLDLAKSDVFINVVGGLRLTEPSADLAVAAALVSSSGSQEINAETCFFGEVGLTGEVRAASFSEDRLREAEKLGFKYFLIPKSNKKHLKNWKSKGTIKWVAHISELPRLLYELVPSSPPKPSVHRKNLSRESLV